MFGSDFPALAEDGEFNKFTDGAIRRLDLVLRGQAVRALSFPAACLRTVLAPTCAASDAAERALARGARAGPGADRDLAEAGQGPGDQPAGHPGAARGRAARGLLRRPRDQRRAARRARRRGGAGAAAAAAAAAELVGTRARRARIAFLERPLPIGLASGSPHVRLRHALPTRTAPVGTRCA
eukprot:scaffold1138_cov217-Prasinococcus_capsulatus_cf.AAC.2